MRLVNIQLAQICFVICIFSAHFSIEIIKLLATIWLTIKIYLLNIQFLFRI